MGTGTRRGPVTPKRCPGCSAVPVLPSALGGRGARGCWRPARGLTPCLDSLSVDVNTGSAEKRPLAELFLPSPCAAPPPQTAPGGRKFLPLAKAAMELFYLLVEASGGLWRGLVCRDRRARGSHTHPRSLQPVPWGVTWGPGELLWQNSFQELAVGIRDEQTGAASE